MHGQRCSPRGSSRPRSRAARGVTPVWRANCEACRDDLVGLREGAVYGAGVERRAPKPRLSPSSGWITGLPGASAASGSTTAGSSSHSTAMCASASSASARRFGDDGRHRLALPARTLDGQRMLRRRFQALQMRQHADPGRADRKQVGAASPPRPRQGRARAGTQIEPLDARMGVRPAQESDVHQPRQHEVADELPPPLHQPRQFGRGTAAADVRVRPVERRERRRSFHPCPIARRGLDRVDDRLVAGAAAVIAG